MTQLSIHRKLATLNPNTPYAELLAEEFGVDVPQSAPMYQKEFLYKYCLVEKYKNTPDEVIVANASIKVNEFIERFPWALIKYETVVESTTPCDRRKGKYADGTIVYNSGTGTKQHHFFNFYYVDNKVVARSKNIEKLYALIETKFGKDASVAARKVAIVTI
jgi:hypothetical protein